ncbi:MAG TPA: protein kinase, partial [Blastocatellia bacterium]|nr:protein kinase [Blastocatellia bacterium]
MASLPPESMLSHYRIKALIAKGGMGEVYKAVDVRLGRVVAIKVPAAIFAGNENARHRFLREARSASILSHPNICTIHEVGREGELDFIVMEYVEGETIKERLSQGPLPLEEALAFAVQIADALDDAHHHGVVHRDIKPTNITINRRGQAVVLDFGLAKQIEYAGLAEVDTQPGLQGVLTVDKSILGTIPYMSPEQVEGAPVDARSDIFSFGVMVYEMIAGRRPFDGRQDVDVMHAILHDEPAALARLRPEAGAELEGVIAKALNKDPAERYQTAGEMRQALLDVARRREFDQITKASLADRESPATTELERARHFPVRKILTAAAAGAVIGLLIYLFVGRGSARAPSVVKLLERNSAPGEYLVMNAKFSPDGQSVVFRPTGGGDPDLWVIPPGGGEPTRITRDKWTERSPIWSPDGRQVAFASDREGQAGIYVVPAQGGTPQLLKGIEPPQPTLVSWSRDKQAIYFEWRSNLHALDVETRQIIQKTNLSDTARGPRSISLSTDESRIAYVEDAGGVSEVRVLSLGGGKPTRVAAATAPTACRLPFWHPDGRRIIYGSNPTGFYQLYVVDYLGDRVPKPLTSDNSEHRVTDVSRDGEKILYVTSVEKAELWEVILGGGPQRRLDSGGAVNLWPEVSPDGQAVTYMSNTAIRGKLTDSAIMVKKLEGEEPPQAIASDGIDVSWSPDGSRLAFIRFKDGRYNIT